MLVKRKSLVASSRRPHRGYEACRDTEQYVHKAVTCDVHLASISGGTDICGCFVLSDTLKPVWRGAIQGAALGLIVDVIDQSGKSVRGEKGDLVLPFDP